MDFAWVLYYETKQGCVCLCYTYNYDVIYAKGNNPHKSHTTRLPLQLTYIYIVLTSWTIIYITTLYIKPVYMFCYIILSN
jgi:hypothetical protein